MEKNDNFTIRDLSVKCKSKIELYNLLAREGKIYLPPKQDASQSYLRDILQGNKFYLRCDEVTVIKVPQYKGLRVNDIIKFASSNLDITKFLPKYSYQKEPNREWLWNVVNSLMTEEFNKFIESKVEIRKQEIINSQNIGITAKPEFIKIFKNSQPISSMKGKSHFLARVPKPTKEQMKIRELEEDKSNNEYKSKVFKLEIQELKDKMMRVEDQLKEGEENIDKLSRLYDAGIIDENDDLITNRME